jgi:DNA-binding FadR family transcriptional regulator
MELRSLKSQDLQHVVQEQLKSYILHSGLKSGDLLPTEKNLAEKFGISRTAIREALRGLETLGIIEVRHGVGRFLREFNFEAILNNLPYSLEVDIKNFREVLEIRLCLESWFIAKDIVKFTINEINVLRAILAELEAQVLSQSDEQELIETHTRFHCTLYQHSENSLLLSLIRIFSTIQRNLTLLHHYKTSNREHFIIQHKLLIEAVEEKDAELAQQRMKEHFAEAFSWVELHKEIFTERR